MNIIHGIVASAALAVATNLACAQCSQWQERSPANPPPAGIDIMLAFDESRNRTVGLIGFAEDPNQVRIREYDGEIWRIPIGQGGAAPTPAGPRYGPAFFYHPPTQKIYLFGGRVGIGGPLTSELWSWDGGSWTLHPPPPGALWPPATPNAMAAWDPTRARIIMLLGIPGEGFQTWEWTGSAWERGPDFGPVGAGTTFAFDSWRQRGVVYTAAAGENWERHWEYTPGATASAGQWHQVPISGPPYDVRVGTSLIFDPYRGRMLRLFGKYSLGLHGYVPAVDYWDHLQARWIEDTSLWLPWERRRAGAGAAFDTHRGMIVVQGGLRYDNVGGVGTYTNYQDTWEMTDFRPGILTHPSPTNVGCVGGEALFASSLFGGPYSYQWFHNGQPIPGATGTLLLRNNLVHAHAGVYQFSATNACGTTFGPAATLEIRDPVSITAPPLYTHQACPGTSPIMIAPQVSGTLPIEVRLQRFDGEFWTDVPGQVGPPGHLFQVLSAQTSDTGLYRFAIENSCGTIYSQSGHLQVGITFSAQPLPMNREPCQNAVFTVGASGVGTIQYQWQRNEVDLVDDGRIVGATTSTLGISGVRYEDEGLYRCIVTDSCHARASSSASLSLPTPAWSLRNQAGPVQRSRSSDMAFDPIRGVSVLFGGYNNGYLDDTWEWDGIEWRQRFPAQNPGRRGEHQLVYDPIHQRVMLFGGWGTVPFNSDVWTYDGHTWSLLTTSPGGPPPGSGYGEAAFDDARGRMIVLAEGPAPQTSRTWEFDPVSLAWTLADSGPGPYYFLNPVVYAPGLSTIVGYHAAAFDPTSTTWHWDGQQWSIALISSFRPGNPQGAWDSVRNRVVFYGCCRGLGQPFPYSETWAYDGVMWSQVLPSFTQNNDAVRPSVMAFDTRRRAMVMGGSTYAGSFGQVPMETWEYRYQDRIQIDRQPADLPLTPGQTAMFRIHAAGAGTLSYQWRKGNTILTNGPQPTGSIISGAATHTLTIENPSAADAGSYQCILSNACGTLPSAVIQFGSTCYANCDGSTVTPVLNVDDFTCFINEFALAQALPHEQQIPHYANCDNSTTAPVLNVDDFTCFINAFAQGCN